MPPDPKKVKALQLNTEGLFRLLGGSADDREAFWGKIIGITTPAEAKLINAQVDSLAAQAKSFGAAAKSLQSSAQQIAKRR